MNFPTEEDWKLLEAIIADKLIAVNGRKNGTSILMIEIMAWLQSRTAVKAENEDEYWAPAEVLMRTYHAEDEEDLQMALTLSPQLKYILEAMETYGNQFKQSQPTAGGESKK